VIAAEAEVRQVARDIRLPARLARRRRVLARTALLDAFRRAVDRQIEVTVKLQRGVPVRRGDLRRRAEHRSNPQRDRAGQQCVPLFHFLSSTE